jgi:hypothetical protein
MGRRASDWEVKDDGSDSMASVDDGRGDEEEQAHYWR